MKMEYKLTEKFTQEVVDELLKIDNEKGLTPEQVVEEAKNKQSPLHSFFDWEDSIAATKWRLAQARILVNEVKVIIEEKEYYAFENVTVTVSNSGEQELGEIVNTSETRRVYKPIIEILNDADLKRQVIASSLMWHKRWEEQNEKYKELYSIIKEASKVRRSLEKKWQKNK